jgi:hypothetical protein
LKKIFSKKSYQGCSIFLDETDIRNIEKVKSKIDFFVENVRMYSNGVTINLVNYFPNNENLAFLIELSDYVKQTQEKIGDVFLSVTVKSSDLSSEIAKIIKTNEICWQLIVTDDSSKNCNFENYLNIRNSTGHLNHGVICYSDAKNKSYAEKFSEVHNSFYGFPISILPTKDADLVKFNKEFYDFLENQKDNLINLKLSEFESFISGNNCFSNLFCYGFKENSIIRQSDYESFCPTIKEEQIFYNSQNFESAYLIGNMKNGIESDKTENLILQESEINRILKKQKLKIDVEKILKESKSFASEIRQFDEYLYDYLCSKI